MVMVLVVLMAILFSSFSTSLDCTPTKPPHAARQLLTTCPLHHQRVELSQPPLRQNLVEASSSQRPAP
eukprot:1548453-Lingulodinium_polyedra.AAC.1